MIIDVSDFEPMPKELADKDLVDKSNENGEEDKEQSSSGNLDSGALDLLLSGRGGKSDWRITNNPIQMRSNSLNLVIELSTIKTVQDLKNFLTQAKDAPNFGVGDIVYLLDRFLTKYSNQSLIFLLSQSGEHKIEWILEKNTLNNEKKIK